MTPVPRHHHLKLWIPGSVMIATMAAIAVLFRMPMLFPPLGASTFLLLHAPESHAAHPRTVIFGHIIGALMGWLSLQAFCAEAPSAAVLMGMDWSHACSAALAVGGTTALMAFFGVPHAPAGATTLVVSLGQLPHLWQVPVIAAAAALLVAQAYVFHRLRGVAYPPTRS